MPGTILLHTISGSDVPVFIHRSFRWWKLTSYKEIFRSSFSVCVCVFVYLFVSMLFVHPFLSCFTLQSRKSVQHPPAGTAAKHNWSGNDQRRWESSAPAVQLWGGETPPLQTQDPVSSILVSKQIQSWSVLEQDNGPLKTSWCCFVADTDIIYI